SFIRPILARPSARRHSTSASFRSWRTFGPAARPPRRRRGPGTGTSRTHSDTDDFATPNCDAIPTSVIPVVRSSRAVSCSPTFPRWPMVGSLVERMFEQQPGKQSAMRFRLGVGVGFAGGYYLGAMAGPERDEQINRLIEKAKRSDTFDELSGKARAAVDLGVERARDAVESRTGNGHNDIGSGPVVAKGTDSGPYASSK